MEFQAFPKIPRLKRDCFITEKLDGTNAQIQIVRSMGPIEGAIAVQHSDGEFGTYMLAGSRSRYITPQSDNYGFAAWVHANATELFTLGEGHHYGEWWGAGIQRRYGLAEKRFSLFNTVRWDGPQRPACCSVVPLLYAGQFSSDAVTTQLNCLRAYGSTAAPGFMQPEGVVVYLVAAQSYFKQLLENDDTPKGTR